MDESLEPSSNREWSRTRRSPRAAGLTVAGEAAWRGSTSEPARRLWRRADPTGSQPVPRYPINALKDWRVLRPISSRWSMANGASTTGPAMRSSPRNSKPFRRRRKHLTRPCRCCCCRRSADYFPVEEWLSMAKGICWLIFLIRICRRDRRGVSKYAETWSKRHAAWHRRIDEGT